MGHEKYGPALGFKACKHNSQSFLRKAVHALCTLVEDYYFRVSKENFSKSTFLYLAAAEIPRVAVKKMFYAHAL